MAGLGRVGLGQARYGKGYNVAVCTFDECVFRCCEASLGAVRSGRVRYGEVRSGAVWQGKGYNVAVCTF